MPAFMVSSWNNLIIGNITDERRRRRLIKPVSRKGAGDRGQGLGKNQWRGRPRPPSVSLRDPAPWLCGS